MFKKRDKILIKSASEIKQERMASLSHLVEMEGLEGLYDHLYDSGIGEDFYLDSDALLYLTSFDKQSKLFPDRDFIEDNLPQETRKLANKNSVTTIKHPTIKEKDGQNMEYLTATRFKSWEGTIENTPLFTFIPKSIVGVKNLISWARMHKKRIRISGYRHTSSEMYSEDHQVLVSMLNMETATHLPAQYPEMNPNNDLQGIQLVGKPYKVDGKLKIKCKIGAATCNYHFQDWVHDPNGGASRWAMPLNVIMTEITFGGSNAMICHGGGIQNKTISDLITKIQFVNVKGKLQTITDKKQIRAAAGCFGLLGFVTSLTFELNEMTYANLKTVEKKLLALTIPPATGTKVSSQVKKHLDKKNRAALKNSTKLNQAFNDFVNQCENSYYAEWFWYPLHPKCWKNCWNNNGDKEKATRYPTKPATDFQKKESYLAYLANKAVRNDTCSQIKKIQTKFMSNLAMRRMPDKPNLVCSLEDAIHFRKGIQNYKTRMMEIEIPIPDIGNTGKADWSICQKAWWAVIDSVYSKENMKYFPMRTTLEMRVMGGTDKILMAAQYGNKRTCSIEIITPVGVNPKVWDKFLQEILDKWSAFKDDKNNYLNIRPHWAKRFDYLFINRGIDWLNDFNDEHKYLLQQYVSVDSNSISIPMRVYLKHIAYKEQLILFKKQLKRICKDGNYEMQDIHEVFSNSFLDYFIFDDKVLNLTNKKLLRKNHSGYFFSSSDSSYKKQSFESTIIDPNNGF